MPENVKPVDNHEMAGPAIRFLIPSTIDTSTELPDYRGIQDREFIFDLSQMKLMNSAGIRGWIHWMRHFYVANQIYLENCPTTFLNIASIIADVVPGQVQIRSICLRYINPDSSDELTVLFPRGADTPAWRIPRAIVKNYVPYEFDGILAKTLGRLKADVDEFPEIAIAQISSLNNASLIKE